MPLPYTRSSLPTLPRVLKKREADVTPRVLEWFRTGSVFAPCLVHKLSDEARRRLPFDGFFLGAVSGAFEIKVTDRKYISESAVLPHQKIALTEVSKNGARAFVVAVFLHRDARIALVIDVRKWTGATPSSPCDFSFTV